MSAPHFDRTAFKVEGGRIFATLDEKSASANLKLSVADQKVFSEYEKGTIYPVPNKWGLKGWTTFELTDMESGIVLDALQCAYRESQK
jgi:hypothetical protein